MADRSTEASAVLRGMLRQRWSSFVLDALVGAAFFLVGVVPGLLAKVFFDSLGDERVARWQTGPLLVAALVAVRLVHVTLGMAWMRIDTRLRGILLSTLRMNLLDRLLAVPAARALTMPVGDVVGRLVEDVRAGVETLCKRAGLMNLTSSVSFTVVAVVVMALIDVRVMLLALLPGLLVMLASYLASQRVQRFRARSRQAAGEVQTLLMEAFSGIQAIKLAGAEEGVAGRLRQLNRQRRAAAVKDNVFSVLLRSLSGAALALGTALILLAAIQPMRHGEFSIGDLALCLYLLAEIGIGVTVTGQFISSWRQAEISVGRLGELQHGAPRADLIRRLPDGPPAPAAPPDGSGSAAPGRLVRLEVRDLSCRQVDGAPALSNVTFDLHAGEVLVVAGRMGAGKSTLLHCLLGMVPRSGGEIRWNGHRVDDPARFFGPPRTAYTPQVPQIFSETIRENIFLGHAYSPRAEAEAVRAAVFERDLAAMPDGALSEVGPRGHRLSGGQVQRLAAARMAARRPELYVMDDMSSALDARTENELWRRHLARAGRTALVVSNRQAALRSADRVLLLVNGRVDATGSLDDLLRRSAQMREIWAAGGGHTEPVPAPDGTAGGPDGRPGVGSG